MEEKCGLFHHLYSLAEKLEKKEVNPAWLLRLKLLGISHSELSNEFIKDFQNSKLRSYSDEFYKNSISILLELHSPAVRFCSVPTSLDSDYVFRIVNPSVNIKEQPQIETTDLFVKSSVPQPKKRKEVEESKQETDMEETPNSEFVTAKQKLNKDNNTNPKSGVASKNSKSSVTAASRRFVPPFLKKSEETPKEKETPKPISLDMDPKELVTALAEDERTRGCEPHMMELILSEIIDTKKPVSWDDIAGLEFAKQTVKEIIINPLLRPDLFSGIREPPKGLLLFGPPGTGKTLIGKAIASQSNSVFFSISASSLTSKWVGEGEKMVRTLFMLARYFSPSVIFIDEVDSLLTQRSENENESSRRIKTEFLVQFDGARVPHGGGQTDRILVIGATNRPQELDDAARRRFTKRLYIPLPDFSARRSLIAHLIKSERNSMTDTELNEIATKCDGYSGADISALCKEAAMMPLRRVKDIQQVHMENLLPLSVRDFDRALKRSKASVSAGDLKSYEEWNKTFGTFHEGENEEDWSD
jgi:SpoVK/Ycf46/Vps4 family AAA+-type ATPase